jgi:hypothetical protein
LKLELGDRIRPSAAQFDRLAKALPAEIRSKFVP